MSDRRFRLRSIPIGLVMFYQRFISPFLAPSCRFDPSCSTYARLAFRKHGTLKGGALALLRIAKCHPFHPGGCDPLG